MNQKESKANRKQKNRKGKRIEQKKRGNSQLGQPNPGSSPPNLTRRQTDPAHPLSLSPTGKRDPDVSVVVPVITLAINAMETAAVTPLFLAINASPRLHDPRTVFPSYSSPISPSFPSLSRLTSPPIPHRSSTTSPRFGAPRRPPGEPPPPLCGLAVSPCPGASYSALSPISLAANHRWQQPWISPATEDFGRLPSPPRASSGDVDLAIFIVTSSRASSASSRRPAQKREGRQTNIRCFN